ncbi:MAG: gamma-glutamyl carboxylase [Polyangiaceae bacterium]|nr:gamma-glutamyl carboxylase [Polyangiaceae bacterium]
MTPTRLAWLLRPVDAAWLAAFRVGYGLALAFSMWRFLAYGWVSDFFVRPKLFFKYWGFSWVQPLSEAGMQALFWGLMAAALCVAAGLAFRLASALFALGLIYVQLIDVSTYLNHYYLAALLALLLAASPAGKYWSVDAWLRKRSEPTVSASWLYLFRLQVGVVYVFAGLAKLQSDWLLHAQPLRIWLGASTELPLIGPLLTLPFVPMLLSWCGFLFDTTVVGFLLWPRARPYAYAVLLAFHAMTRVLFPIGMFPVIMSLSALVFFSPSFPRRLWSKLGPAPRPSPTPPPGRFATAGLLLAGCYALIQLVMPLRYLAYGGNVLWHEQGMRFSWRVMVRAKGGGTTFVVYSPARRHTYYVSPREYLTRVQEAEMSNQPDLILQLAHHIHDDFQRRGYGDVQVRAESRVGLNGRSSAPFLDASVDLSRLSDGLRAASFILPAPSQAPPHTRPVL